MHSKNIKIIKIKNKFKMKITSSNIFYIFKFPLYFRTWAKFSIKININLEYNFKINLEYKLQGAIPHYFLKKLIFHYIFQRGPIFKKKSI